MAALVELASVATIVNLAAKSLAVMLASALLATLLSRASAAWRHLAWCVGIAALLILPVLFLGLPPWQTSWLPVWHEQSTMNAVAMPQVIPALADRVTGPDSQPSGDPSVHFPAEVTPASDPLPRPTVAPAADAAIESNHTPWSTWLILAWLIGVALALSPIAVGLCQLARLSRGSSPVTEASWLSLLNLLRTHLGLRRRVVLRLSTRTVMPVTWGALFPVVLVPAEADAWSSERRRLVLMHELAHIRRWDWPTQMLSHVACALYWWNPLVWVAARQMRIEQEKACDDLVLASGVKACDYAQQLLHFAAGLADPKLASLAAVPIARRSVLEGRLKAILDGRLNRAALTSGAVCLVAVLATAIVAPLAMLRASPEVQGEKSAALNLGIIAPQTPGKAAQAPASPLNEASKQVSDKTKGKVVTIRGKVVDDETGKPVERLIVQAGRFAPADPSKITWGYSENRSSVRDGSFNTTINWAEGWTARILADGYVPQPVISSPPPAGKEEIEVTIRLKRGRTVKGQVLEHTGQPVKGAAVFAIGPTGLNLAAGKAWQPWGNEDAARPVLTDEAGRFELPAGEAKLLAVSYLGLDAWPAAIPAEGQIVVRLPQSARVDVEYNIVGADKEAMVFYQLLTHLTPEFAGLQSSRALPIANGGKLSLPALPPGKYQIGRQVTNRLDQVGTGGILDREFFEITAGEIKEIHWVRDKGVQIRGKITWPEGVKLAGTIVSVKSLKSVKDPFQGNEWQTTYASQTADADGSFLTERILPGRYLLVAEAFTPRKQEVPVGTGFIGPSFQAETTIDVPESGILVVPDLTLRPVPGR
jgi:beta-lactamase regulating signal transducer with metallopeptidase domain